MSKILEKGTRENPARLLGVILPFLPSLFLKSGWAFLLFKMEVKKGGQTFHRELMDQGFDKLTADKLTEIYLKGGNLLQSLINM